MPPIWEDMDSKDRHLAWMDRAKMERWGPGVASSWKEADKRARVGREEEGTSSNRPELGGIVLALQSAVLSEDVLLLCDNEALLCAIKEVGGAGRQRRR